MSYPRNLQYALLPKAEWDHVTERLQDCGGVTIVDITKLGEHVHAATGRGHMLANGNIGRKLRSGGRVYIAPERARGRYGILIQKVTP
jgi:hypothetical protein